jgi:protein-tyrosine phosphatase
MSRVLGWQGALNVRDLGGLPLADGRETRRGAVVRSAALGRLTDSGWRALEEHGVRTIVDLRCPSELDTTAPDSIVLVHATLWETHDVRFAMAMAACDTWEAFYRLVVDDRAAQIARAVGSVADARAGGVLVHCHAGKDRTGIVCALMLSLAGVPDGAIADDFAASGEALRPVLADADDADVPPELILRVLGRVRGRHGTVRGYLLDTGATVSQLDRLVARLRP